MLQMFFLHFFILSHVVTLLLFLSLTLILPTSHSLTLIFPTQGLLSGALDSESINSVMANFNIDPAPGMANMVSG